jgi:hypothetical protein
LDNYYEGLTSVADENKLRSYLKQYDGDNPELLEAKMLFGALDAEKSETLDLDFERFFEPKQPTKIRKMLIYMGSIAAAAVIVLSVNFMLRVTEKPVIYAYINGEPISDKEVAIEYSKQAMKNLSVQFNKGTENLSCMSTLNKPAILLKSIKQ